jgi:hypothetical protein
MFAVMFLMINILLVIGVPVYVAVRSKRGITRKWASLIGWPLFLFGLLVLGVPTQQKADAARYQVRFSPGWWGTITGEYMFIVLGNALLVFSVSPKKVDK